MKKFWKNKKGFISIYMILWMSVLIPILMFTAIDLSHYIYEGVHLKAVTDNAAASAVTQIKEDLVPQGILQIDETRATNVANQVIKDDVLLNDDYSPKTHSDLRDKATVNVYVVNTTSDTGYDFATPAGTVKIYKPSVVVYAKYPVNGLFYTNANVNIERVGVSQVQFNHD
ncbi:cobalt ABC transporter permease (plasmid) [Aneurinibacillus sp. Ricciae_BoGa-3]|uniref:TadE/TadG family type IV pilus assembly protein n=1 Tax=Aneurinibacillus sp. Ricciae_BoGa-3 TaxID=3022697 RepID=UPI002340215D|nr:cobalt ABC transporter permease [Aneurinibacillus sp. Ricciae_BoGa-3]WCK57687.1 cobalt ABC transporter permease [Aneurinibacillus sp. Ricciae_BoGa-3]